MLDSAYYTTLNEKYPYFLIYSFIFCCCRQQEHYKVEMKRKQKMYATMYLCYIVPPLILYFIFIQFCFVTFFAVMLSSSITRHFLSSIFILSNGPEVICSFVHAYLFVAFSIFNIFIYYILIRLAIVQQILIPMHGINFVLRTSRNDNVCAT